MGNTATGVELPSTEHALRQLPLALRVSINKFHHGQDSNDLYNRSTPESPLAPAIRMLFLAIAFYGLIFVVVFGLILRMLLSLGKNIFPFIGGLLALGLVAAMGFGLFYLTVRWQVIWVVIFSGLFLFMTTLARNALAGGAGILAQVTNAIHLVVKCAFILSFALFIYGRVVFAVGRHFKGD